MNKGYCNECRYHLKSELPHNQCLRVYNQGVFAVEDIKDGLIGRCTAHKYPIKVKDR